MGCNNGVSVVNSGMSVVCLVDTHSCAPDVNVKGGGQAEINDIPTDSR